MQSSNFEVFKYNLIVRENHLDTFGHVNNATYLQMLEEARWEFISSRGYDLNYVQKVGIGPVILEINMKFLKELCLRQKITIESQTISYQNKIASLRQDIFSEAGELCFQSKMTFGLFDLKARKLIMPTTEWSYAIGMSETKVEIK